MKKLNYFLLGLAGLTLASCSQDDVLNNGINDGNYQITVKLPADMATRAIGDQATAAQLLNYAIYDMENNFVEKGTANFLNGATEMTLPLQLTIGAEYQIAFFAQSPNSTEVYSFNAEGNTVSVDYSKMTSDVNNADGYDCFYKKINTKVIGSADMVTEAILTRPVAQINWGSNDLTSAAVLNSFFPNGLEGLPNNLYTTVTVMAFNTMNLLNGEVSGEATVTLPAMTPIETVGFPVDGYNYVAMQYVLAGAKEVSNLTLNINNTEDMDTPKNTIEVSGAPLQANYRTNIYGALLTSTTDFTVKLSADWGTPSTNIVWDGQTITIPTIVENPDGTKSATISDGATLAGLASLVKGGNDLSDVTITLTDDINLGDYPFPGIGIAERSGSSTAEGTTPFRGTFDGNGRTISGLNINYTGTNGDVVAAFIPNLDGEGTVKNVTFDEVTINGGAAEQAGIVGLVTNGATVDGVTINSGSITATEGAGIVGRMLMKGTVTNCTNYADVTVSKKNGAGIVGAAYYGNQGMTISYCKNYGKVVATDKVESIGGIVATCSATVQNCTNYGQIGDSNIAAPAGGIVGYQISSGSIIDCVNEGTIMGAAEVAGIVAFIGGTNYAGYTSDIYVTGNTNKGVLIASGSVGGILGINRNGCYLQDNTNSAPSMTGSTVAGIVGSAMKSGTLADGYVHLVSGNVNNTSPENMHGTRTNDLFNGTLYVGEDLQTN